MKTVLDIISIDQLKALKEAGLIVVHRVPTHSMCRAATRDEWPEQSSSADKYHRMVAESIRLQNLDITGDK